MLHKYAQMGLTLQEKDFTDYEVVAAIVRITGGCTKRPIMLNHHGQISGDRSRKRVNAEGYEEMF